MTSVEQQPALTSRDDLEHDSQLLTQISRLSQQLVTSHEQLVEVVENATTKLSEQLASLDERSSTVSDADQLTLVATSNRLNKIGTMYNVRGINKFKRRNLWFQ